MVNDRDYCDYCKFDCYVHYLVYYYDNNTNDFNYTKGLNI